MMMIPIVKKDKLSSKKTLNKIQFKIPHHYHSIPHARTTSVPSVLPSQQDHNKLTNKLSLDILLDAIDLDQQMRQFFRSEVIKSKSHKIVANYHHRNQLPLSSSAFSSSSLIARRRSRSAPGAPPSYHHQRAFNSRWISPIFNNSSAVTSEFQAQKVAQLIVQKHLDAVRKR
ncbi:MAG: hypothetical protein EXX96DRAFT_549654 [Benjaminiella poitrasii]|nr:MAG: hypothetical protein EXX96DRAFT_549654 [Benjaminiella poitrasii]